MRDRHHVLPDANFDGPALLQEQTQLLSESSPADINFLHFLKLRLTAQQRATAQRNYWQRVLQSADDTSSHAAGTIAGRGTTAASWATPTFTPIVEAEAYPAAASWNVQPTPSGSVFGGARNTSERHHEQAAASATHGPRSPLEDSSLYSGSVVSRLDGSSSALPPPSHQQQQQQQQQRPTPVAHQIAFEDLPASAAKRAMTREPAALDTPSAFSMEGRAGTLDEQPAVASGRPQLPVGAEEVKSVTLKPCPHCGRTFAPDRLERHATTCERQQVTNPKMKADGKDRKASGASASSHGKPERAGAAAASSNPKPTAAAAAAAASPAAKTEKWRRQSAQLRSALAGTATAEDDRVQCPHCARRFAEDAAGRHIPICKAKEARHA